MRKLIGDELADRLVTFGVRLGGHTLSHALALAGREILNMLHSDAKGGTVSLENLSQNQRAAIQGVEVKKERIAEFDRFAQKYGLQYTAIEEENDPNMVFLTFRQRDIDKLDKPSKEIADQGGEGKRIHQSGPLPGRRHLRRHDGPPRFQ